MMQARQQQRRPGRGWVRLACAIRGLGAAVLGGCIPLHPLAAQGTAPAPSVDQPLSLAEAMSRALASNLELRVARSDTGLARSQLIGSRLRPNPALSLQFQTTGDNGPAGLESDASVSLTQDLQLWGLRGKRIRAASLEVERSRYGAAAVERTLRRDVAASYRDLVFQQLRVAILDSLARVTSRIARAAQLAFTQGLGSELDTRVSAASWGQAELDRDAAAREFDIQQVQLARLLGDSLTSRYDLTDSLPAAGLRFLARQTSATAAPKAVRYELDQASLDSLIQLALSRRPDLRAAEKEVEVQQASLGAARAAGKPTVAVGALYSRSRDNFEVAGQPESDLDNVFGLGAVIGLPFLNRNQGEIARAQAAEAGAVIRVANTRQAVERDVRVAAQQAALAASRMETLQQAILPANQAGLRIAETAFSRGQVNILQVLQVQRGYVESTTALLEATRQLATALADLEAAVGEPVQ